MSADMTATEIAEFRSWKHDKVERERKRGGYWLTPEGRDEIRGIWDEATDLPIVLLTALEVAEERADAVRGALEAVISQAIADAVAAEREACASLCDGFAGERAAARERFAPGDERRDWIVCKQSEAVRCANRIRARSCRGEEVDRG